jgi:hypothetical protein
VYIVEGFFDYIKTPILHLALMAKVAVVGKLRLNSSKGIFFQRAVRVNDLTLAWHLTETAFAEIARNVGKAARFADILFGVVVENII